MNQAMLTIFSEDMEKIARKKARSQSKFKRLKRYQVPLTPEERKKVMDRKATWNHNPGGGASSAVWKSVFPDGTTMYTTNTHRAYQTRPTVEGAISIYHRFIKGTA